ncbi:MAG: esterase-like activity of phytase family protein [Alphaproteobacteria bacterium]
MAITFIRYAGVLGFLFCFFCAPLSAANQQNGLRIEPFSLKPDRPHDIEFPSQHQIGRLIFLGGIALRSDNPAFGGLSALRVSSDGQQALALSDRGRFWNFALAYNQQGWLSGASILGNFRMQTDVTGRPLGDGMRDSEAMEWAGDGGVIVSFEHHHRIWRFPPSNTDKNLDLTTSHSGNIGGSTVDTPRLLPRDAPKNFPAPSDLKNAPSNGGIEALVALTPQGADGPLLALAEQYLAEMGEITSVHGWLRNNQEWHDLRYRVSEGFRPTDAARLPNGDIVVLERRINLPFDLGTRIVQVKAETIKAGALLEGKELIRFDASLPKDNFEGLAVRQDDAGKVYLYVISDDNFNAQLIQRTWLLMFGLGS